MNLSDLASGSGEGAVQETTGDNDSDAHAAIVALSAVTVGLLLAILVLVVLGWRALVKTDSSPRFAYVEVIEETLV